MNKSTKKRKAKWLKQTYPLLEGINLLPKERVSINLMSALISRISSGEIEIDAMNLDNKLEDRFTDTIPRERLGQPVEVGGTFKIVWSKAEQPSGGFEPEIRNGRRRVRK